MIGAPRIRFGWLKTHRNARNEDTLLSPRKIGRSGEGKTIDLNKADNVVPVLYGAGIRNTTQSVTHETGDTESPVAFTGVPETHAGLDRIQRKHR